MIATTTSPDPSVTADPTLLLLTGWCDDRAQFDPLLAEAGRHRRTVSMDWRGHGGSADADGDFGLEELVADALEVIGRTGAPRVVPVAVSHAGWVAVELRRRLGEQVAGLVLVDWMVLGTPPGFEGALRGLQDPDAWEVVREQLFGLWTEGVDHPAVLESVRRMAKHGQEMWARAGREIARSFEAEPVPATALAGLGCPVLHLYAQPDDPGFLRAQQQLAEQAPWFEVQKLEARSHFPMLEVPEEMAALIESWVARNG